MSQLFQDDTSQNFLLLARLRQVSELLPSEAQKRAAIKLELQSLTQLGAVTFHSDVEAATTWAYQELWQQ